MAGESPFGGLLQGLGAINALQNIQQNKTAQDLELLKMFMLQQNAAKEQQAQERVLQGQEILSKALGSVDYSDNPTDALPQIGLGLSLIGQPDALKPIAELFNNITQRNLYTAAINMVDAFRTGNSFSFIKSLEKLERYRTNMPWQAIIRGVNKGAVDVEFVLPMPDGKPASRTVRFSEEDLLRYAANLSENPQNFAAGHAAFAKLPSEIALLDAQARERRAKAEENRASAEKLKTEAHDIRATQPGRLEGLRLANLAAQLANDENALKNAKSQLEARLIIGSLSMKYGNELMNALNTPELGLPTDMMPDLKAYATLMAKYQLMGQNVDATVAAQEFALALRDKAKGKTPFVGYGIEVFDIIPPEIKRQLGGLPPQPVGPEPFYPPTTDRMTGKAPPITPAGPDRAPTVVPGQVPTLEQQRKIIEAARKAGRIQRGYAFFSPTVGRIVVSETDANALRRILGVQFTVTTDLPTDVIQAPPVPPPLTDRELRELNQTNPPGA